jgi:hypothetical protein
MTLLNEARSTLRDEIFVAELPHLLSVWQVPGSNLGLETGYPDKLLLYFLRPFRQILEYYLKLCSYRFLSRNFKFIVRYS